MSHLGLNLNINEFSGDIWIKLGWPRDSCIIFIKNIGTLQTETCMNLRTIIIYYFCPDISVVILD